MSTDEKDPKNPATTSNAYDVMIPRLTVVETVLGGTEAMRAAGQSFLPMHAEETQDGYDARLAGATLLNMVEQTLDTVSGKPFAEPIKQNDDIPAKILDDVFPDVDMQGNNVDVFARQWFREGMAKAFAHVLVDFPKPEVHEEGQVRTLADDRKEGLRPYWVMIKPENLIFATATIESGKEVLTHIRILETYTEQDGFAEVEKVRIRILEPGTVQLWVPVEKKTSGQKEEWRMDEEWPTGLDYIPLVTYYADREGFMLGKPPLLDLTWLNIAHWRSAADQRNILTVTRFPILACSGASGEDGDPVVVGPNKILYNPDPKGKFYYVEHTGAAIEAGRNDLQDLEAQMAGYGAEFLKKKPGNETATARAIDSAEASSDLAAMVMTFEDAMSQVLAITADWLSLAKEGGGTVELVKDYNGEDIDPTTLEFLKYLREKNDISREALINMAKLRNLLPEDFDAEADWEAIAEELTARSELGAALFDLDPGQEDKGDDKGGKDDKDDDDDKKKTQKKPKGDDK